MVHERALQWVGDMQDASNDWAGLGDYCWGTNRVRRGAGDETGRASREPASSLQVERFGHAVASTAGAPDLTPDLVALARVTVACHRTSSFWGWLGSFHN
jgi:hypothetical protein